VVTLRRREADVLACVLEAVVPPVGDLPPPRQTDAVAAFDHMLGRLPILNRAGLRCLLWALELGPLLERGCCRLTRLTSSERAAYVERFERGPAGRAAGALLALVKLSYYGDAGVMARLGYDPEPVMARARLLRATEERW